MNMFKKNGGFTLVELIVVIAILAILAGVAVPAYSGYIAKAQQAGDLQILSTVNTAAQGLAVGEGATVTKIEVAAGATPATITVTTDPAVTTINKAAIETLTDTLKFSDNFPGATWENGKWTLN